MSGKKASSSAGGTATGPSRTIAISEVASLGARACSSSCRPSLSPPTPRSLCGASRRDDNKPRPFPYKGATPFPPPRSGRLWPPLVPFNDAVVLRQPSTAAFPAPPAPPAPRECGVLCDGKVRSSAMAQRHVLAIFSARSRLDPLGAGVGTDYICNLYNCVYKYRCMYKHRNGISLGRRGDNVTTTGADPAGPLTWQVCC